VVLAFSLFLLGFFAGPSLAQDDEVLKNDLTAVIALQGLPCGEVVAVNRVYLKAEGRVVVEKLA
jgi:hypothetical protein